MPKDSKSAGWHPSSVEWLSELSKSADIEEGGGSANPEPTMDASTACGSKMCVVGGGDSASKEETINSRRSKSGVDAWTASFLVLTIEHDEDDGRRLSSTTTIGTTAPAFTTIANAWNQEYSGWLLLRLTTLGRVYTRILKNPPMG